MRKNLRYLHAARHRVRADPLGRPALPHGLRRDARHARRAQGRRHDRRQAGARSRSRARWASCASTTPAASSGFVEKPKTDDAARTDVRDGPGVDRRPRRRQRRPRLPGQHGHLPVQPRRRWSTLLAKTNYHDFGREVFPAAIRTRQRAGPPVRRLLGRHRHDPLVLRGEPAARPAEPAVRPDSTPRRRSTRGPASCRRRASTARRSQRSLVADGCVIGAGRADREQRRSACAAASAAT